MKIREPVVAGSFYPEQSGKLRELMDKLLEFELDSIKIGLAKGSAIAGGIVPHAGYQYSGYEAVHFFKILEESGNHFDTVILMHPNHYGRGPGIASDDADYWETPLGRVRIDTHLIDLLGLQRFSGAYSHEHAAEVILPFLQRFLEYEFRVVPISFLDQDPDTARQIGNKIFEVSSRENRNILLIASSDFSHYVDPLIGEKTDRRIIDHILSLDPERMYREKVTTGATLCGTGPILALMQYCRKLDGNIKSELLKFGNSGKSGPSDRVVDYASIIFYRE